MRIPCARTFALAATALWTCLCAHDAVARTGWQPGDWVLFSDYSTVSSFAESQREVWMSTPNALLRIDKFSGQWGPPISRYELGFSDPIERVGYDNKTNQAVVLSHGAFYSFSPEMLTSGSLFWGQGTPSAFANNGCAQRWPLFAIEEGMFDPDKKLIRDAQLVEHPMIACYHDGWNAQWISFDGLGIYRGENNSPFLTHKTMGLRDARASVVRRLGERMWVAPNALGPVRGQLRERYRVDGPAAGLDPRGLTNMDATSGDAHYFEMSMGKLPIQGVTSLVMWDGYLAVGTESGFYALDTSTGFLRYTKRSVRLPGEQVRDLCVAWGRLWVGTDNGMATVDSNTWTVSQDSAAFGHMRVNRLRFRKDTLWCAAEHGLWYRTAWLGAWTVDTNMYIPGRAGFEVNDALFDGDSVVYIADPSGLVIIDRIHHTVDDVAHGQTHTITAPHAPVPGANFGATTSNPTVLVSLGRFGEVLELDASGPYVWAASATGLIRVRRDTHAYRVYSSVDGLPSDRIASLTVDGDYVWVGTQHGLVRFWWNAPERDDD